MEFLSKMEMQSLYFEFRVGEKVKVYFKRDLLNLFTLQNLNSAIMAIFTPASLSVYYMYYMFIIVLDA